MQKWTTDSPGTHDVAVLLLPRFSNHCLANAVEPLRAVNDLLMRKAYRWRYVTLDGDAVVSSSGLPVVPCCRLRDHPDGKMLFVMPSYGVRDLATARTAHALGAAARRFQTVVGMDTGAWLMAAAGLLDGRSATIHRDEKTALAEAFPLLEIIDDRYALDEDRATCGGAMAAFELVLELIRRRHGVATALEVSALFLHDGDAGHQGYLGKANVSPLVDACLVIMSETLETPLLISQLAARLGSTQRTLARAFWADLGAAPKTVYKRMRLGAARRYAHQSRYSVAEIADRCGYRNAASMTRAFVEQYGVTPTELRASPD